ncbi:MAG: hypothetical protein AB7V16_02100 [Vulcanibacillus sp.]
MSLKSIELQLSMPKTQEIGKLQEHIHQRTNIEQSLITSQLKITEIEKRKKTQKTDKAKLQEDNTLKRPKTLDNQYKGNFIDIEI